MCLAWCVQAGNWLVREGALEAGDGLGHVCVCLGAGENDQRTASELTLLSGWAPVLSHAPPQYSTSSKLSLPFVPLLPLRGKPSTHFPSHPAALTHLRECGLLWKGCFEWLCLRPQNWVWGLWRVGGEGSRPSGRLGSEGDSGCRLGRAFVLCTVPSWAMTYSRLSPLGGGVGSESASS